MNTYVTQLKEEYEKRLRACERMIHGEKERRRQLSFYCKQLEAQLKKVRRDNNGLEKQLKAMRKCASCSHLDDRSKSYNAMNELLHGSVPALEPETIASLGAPPRGNNEMKYIKVANSNLQQCVDELQSMLREKGREAMATEKYYNEAVLERERQISRLQNELETRWKGASTQSAINQHAETKLKTLLKERTELLDRINRLENANKENYGVMRTETECAARSSTSAAVEDDVNPYCEYCRNRVESWNKMMDGKEMDSIGFMNNVPKDSNRLVQEMADREKKIQKLSLALEMEKSRSKAVENALKNENDTLSNNYQKLHRQLEALEVELAKRRNAEQNARDKMGHNGSTAPEHDVHLVSHLRNELEKANIRGKELALSKQTIYKDAQFASAQLHRQIEMLEKHQRELTAIVESQKAQLLQFEDEVALLTGEKGALQRKCTELERANTSAIQEKLQQLEVIETLRKELSRVEEGQNESAKAYDDQIKTYQQLIKQKDDERGALIAELCTTSRAEIPLYDPIGEIQNRHAEADENRELLKELRELNHEKQSMLDKLTHLESEFESVKDQLRCKIEELEQEVILKNSMHDDLAKARTMLLEKEAEILDFDNQLKVAEVKIMKLETELANATDRLQMEQSTGNTLKIAVEELEDMLQEKNTELIAAAQERQRCTSEIQKMKELKYDLETKLTLQGRELKETREKLAALRKKIQELEQEAVNSGDKAVLGGNTQQVSTKPTTQAATQTDSNMCDPPNS